MATFSIDNDRLTAGIQDLTYDQTSGVQSPPDGDETNVTLTAGEIDGLDAGFETFLAGLGLSTDQKNFAVNTDAASSSNTFIRVTADSGETLNDLNLIADSSTALTTIETLAGDSIFVHVDASGNYATLWTSSDDSGRIVGAVALKNETIDNVTTHTATAGVQMVFFEAVAQTDTNSQDETVSLSDVLKVGVDTAVSFNFEQLAAGNFLWAAVGDADSAMLITGQDLNVKDTGSPAQIGNIDKGNPDPSDAVNTSKASDTTIGINAQHFAPTTTGDGATGVFTFVTGYAPLDSATPVFTGQNVKQINYDDYINVSSASIFISQLTGSGDAIMHFSLWEAGGGGPTDKAPGDLQPEEGYTDVSGQSQSYIGNQNTDSHLTDDTPVDVGSVEITRGATTYVFSGAGGTQAGITVTIDGNDVTVDGALANDAIKLIAENDAGSSVDGTFNRIDIQALAGSANFDIGHIDLSSGGLTSADLGSHLLADDDGPGLGLSTDVNKPNDLQVDNNLGDAADSTDNSFYVLGPGTDGQKSYTIVNPSDGTHTPDNSGTFRWTYNDSTFTSITGTFRDANNVDHNLYTLVLNPTTGAYTFTMTGTVPSTTEGLSSTIIHAGGPTDTVDVKAVSPSTDFGRIVADSTVGNGLVNASHGFVGVDNGNLDSNESLNLSLHKANGDLIEISGITIGTKSAGTSYYDYFVHMSDGSDVQVGDNVTVGKNGTITVNDPNPNDNILIESITVFKVDGNAIKIGLGDIDFLLPPQDLQLGFTVELKDNDNDITTKNFVVDIDADNDGDFEATVNSLSAINSLNDHLFV